MAFAKSKPKQKLGSLEGEEPKRSTVAERTTEEERPTFHWK